MLVPSIINIRHCNHNACINAVCYYSIFLFFNIFILNEKIMTCIGGNICHLWLITLIIETLTTRADVYYVHLNACIVSKINHHHHHYYTSDHWWSVNLLTMSDKWVSIKTSGLYFKITRIF